MDNARLVPRRKAAILSRLEDIPSITDRWLQDADCRRLFLYTAHPDPWSLVQEFGDGDGLAKMVDTAIEQCTTKDLLPDLPREIEKANPRMYARYESQLFG